MPMLQRFLALLDGSSQRPRKPAPPPLPESLHALLEARGYPLRVSEGRDIGAGHLRGWGLEYGGLMATITADPLFAQAFAAARDRGSLLHEHKLANLYLILRYALGDDGDVFEFGSFRGGSAVFMANVLRGLGRSSKVLAFDTYEGMPDTDAVRDLHRRGDFADTGYDGLLAYIDEQGLSPWIETVKGEFGATLPGILARNPRIALVHVDCDIYEPIKYVVRSSLPALSPRAHIVFDDPLHGSCLGAFDAVQELLIRELGLTAEQAYPHLVFRYPPLVAASPAGDTPLG